MFHLLLVPPAIGLLWSKSLPGNSLFLLMGAIASLLIGAAVWMSRVVGFAVALRRGVNDGRPIAFLAAPALGLLVLALLLGDVPFRARWAASRPAFDDVVEAVQRGEPFAGAQSRRIGLYEITNVDWEGEALIFSEAHGAVFNEAGFAYLPDGPFPELETGTFENPTFEHLGGPWYSWTASW